MIADDLQALARRMTGDLASLDHAKLDALEAAMLDSGLPVVHLPVVHTFTPGLYSREVFMPAGTALTSKRHATTHQYVVLSGIVHVAIPGEDAVVLAAGHVGVTKAGTRRALYVEADCRWVTFHVLSNDEEEARAAGVSEAVLVEMIGERIIGKSERADARDTHREYREALQRAGLPGPNEGSSQALLK